VERTDNKMDDRKLSYEDSPEEVWWKEVRAAMDMPWNDGLPEGYVRYQMPNGSMGTFDTSVTPDLGQTFVGRLRISAEQSATGKAGWTRLRLLSRLGPGRYLVDVGTRWERVMEGWLDRDVACIGVLVEQHALVFDPDGPVYLLKT